MDGSLHCSLTIFQWNCNGLWAHQIEFKQHIAQNYYDVICLQETCLKPNRHFSLVRKDKTDANKGGLVTLVKDTLSYTEIVIQHNIECIVVKIKSDNSYITVANLYIPPNQNVDASLLSSLFTLKTIIVVDLNAKSTLWGSPDTDYRGKVIENLIDDNNFITINNCQPTYVHYNGTRSNLGLSHLGY